MRWFFIFSESLQSAYRTVTLNKLRTFLSLLGVTIGIFSIISVLAVIDSLKQNMKDTLDSFGSDIIVIEKFPLGPEEGTEYAWWEYLNRPVTTLNEYYTLKNRIKHIEASCFIGLIQSDVKYLDIVLGNQQIWGVSEGFDNLRSFDIHKGRFLSLSELNSGKNVSLIGFSIAEDLFKGLDPIGRKIEFNGKESTVIGVFAKEGKSILGGGSLDNAVIVPVKYFSSFADLKKDNSNPQIWLTPVKGISVDEFKAEIKSNMRSIRRLSPKSKNNFALNEMAMMRGIIDQIFKVVNLAGWFIGIFAVLVGAFGIANIMFVSVKERTNIIGIQKAIGAKSYYIIIEVLNESVLLSVIGGVIGLILIYVGTLIARSYDQIIYLSFGNIITGLLISSTVGLISGLLPAVTAARLNPVKAIASTF